MTNKFENIGSFYDYISSYLYDIECGEDGWYNTTILRTSGDVYADAHLTIEIPCRGIDSAYEQIVKAIKNDK